MYVIVKIFKAAFIIITNKALHPEHGGRKVAILVVQEEARGEAIRGTSDNVLVVGTVKTNKVSIREFGSR